MPSPLTIFPGHIENGRFVFKSLETEGIGGRSVKIQSSSWISSLFFKARSIKIRYREKKGLEVKSIYLNKQSLKKRIGCEAKVKSLVERLNLIVGKQRRKMNELYTLMLGEPQTQNQHSLQEWNIEKVSIDEGEITPEEYEQIQKYINEHQTEWVNSGDLYLYLHKEETGLPRTLFWIRGEGTFIRLIPKSRLEHIQEVKKSCRINQNELIKILKYVRKRCFEWDHNPHQVLQLSSKKTGLACDLVYYSREGLSIIPRQRAFSLEKPDEVFVEYKFFNPFLIAMGTFKKFSLAYHIESEGFVAVGTAGRMHPHHPFLINGTQGIRQTELIAFHELDHPHIIKGRAITYFGKKTDPYTDQKLMKKAIITPWYQIGCLLNAALNFQEKVQVSVDILEALTYMHQKGWGHFDLKPDNVLLDNNNRAVIADLGFAARLKERRYFIGGTLGYIAPEMFVDELYGNTTSAVDIFALGVLIFELFKNDELFFKDYGVEDWAVLSREDYERKLRKVLGDSPIDRLIANMLSYDYRDRIKAKDALEVMRGLAFT